MFSEISFQLYQYMETLQEPFRFLLYLALYIGLPVLIFLLLYIDKIIQNKKDEIWKGV